MFASDLSKRSHICSYGGPSLSMTTSWIPQWRKDAFNPCTRFTTKPDKSLAKACALFL